MIPPASLADHIGLTDRIQKRSLTVVNMTHNADYRRIWATISVSDPPHLLQKLFDHVYLDFLLAKNIKLHGDFFRLLDNQSPG